MAAKKLLRLVSGIVTEIVGTVVSTGVSNDGDFVALDPTGKLDPSVLPIGVGPDVIVLPTTENIAAGRYVNIFNNGGVPSVRLADNSNSRQAHGFVKASTTSPANATVYFEGPNDSLSGLTAGQRQYLGTTGQATTTPPTTAGGAQISQYLGVSVNTTTINTDIEDEIILA